MTNHPRYITVAVAGPLRRTFTYSVSAGESDLEAGQRLLVPFGRSRKVGYYLGPGRKPPGVDVKPVERVLDPHSLISGELARFCLWLAEYYFANPADCLELALPPPVRRARKARLVWSRSPDYGLGNAIKALIRPGRAVSRKDLDTIASVRRGLLRKLISDGLIVEEFAAADEQPRRELAGYSAADQSTWGLFFDRRRRVFDRFEGVRTAAELAECGWTDHYIAAARRAGALLPRYREAGDILSFVAPRADVAKIHLTEEQQAACDTVSHDLGNGFKPTLLFGITGSGKTIVYCHLARRVLERNETALILTPEIALSGTTLAYFRGFFGSDVTVIHSAMTDRERLDSWQGIRQGRYRIVIGPRSALFAPLQRLGLIVVDEEHDDSYKQDDPSPRFHGRDAAIMRAKLAGVPVLLGSASPSVETFYRAQGGQYRLMKLTRRPGPARLPQIKLVDMRTRRLAGDLPYMSFDLKQEIDQTIESGRQTILFLNRRGYAPQLKCAECGHAPACPNCQVTLTYHRAGRKLSCHYCGYSLGTCDRCEKCGSRDFLFPGVGTQKVEEAVPRLFSEARVIRFDSDTAGGRVAGHDILRRFAAEEFNLLLGTQMVTKGLDLPMVSLVGVLSADLGLDLPDFRASERSFSRLLQVAGRSGRQSHPGRVVIQTYTPESPLFDDVARQDYESFYAQEIGAREQYQYPPFVRLVNVTVNGRDDTRVRSAIADFRSRLQDRLGKVNIPNTLLGPTSCPLHFLRGRYRHHLLVKTTRMVSLVRLLTDWETAQPRFGLPSTVRIAVDVDPVDLM